jgi:hypothetical protein
MKMNLTLTDLDIHTVNQFSVLSEIVVFGVADAGT